ncbi:bacillithiol biosynthesis deacetylase BshB2 [Rossellomorea marisflavi]|jgi:N-acetylglucosamine malate deacetylase 2|uniref:Deacetylase n=2 Tax=Rossellomorea marisflavi TaxID=189381 RepID=A0A0M0FZY6_9BACI|nr:bacillithiol biosynthesis deacetylase BshB2 [Rossellomorea marisflavi]MBV6684537.1 bacillithiol biosynthesis deacetylase BshB2 [Bacillus sp. JRC01]KON83068.1 deacetylase [Rossellomorea marisflavi]KZE50535.1 bacillithiol biosynthesis deacetylase BshB2 [Rossellomorea marisflavi]MDR4935114.1 bacillithiol biosynthesis deacetylase BshB2 [Rossellomorea marisflavi]GLI84489.1 bacillithiol biosynthesis deacetylase BshB2 [Rossellomorea marisflavi]
MEKERQLLVIFPHPDDEAFGVSGTISSHVNNGTPVTYACLTLGEMGRNLGNPPFATRESLPLIRKKELQKAAEVMGIQDLRMMGYRDKTVEFENDEKLANMVTELIEELDPSLIITFYPGYSVHPDHEATARAVIRAVRRLPKASRPKLHCLAFSNGCEKELGQPDITVDISAVKEQKLNTMRAHISQTAWMLKDLDKGIEQNDPEALRWVTNERFWSYQWENDSVE